jgi:hypothetical protein
MLVKFNVEILNSKRVGDILIVSKWLYGFLHYGYIFWEVPTFKVIHSKENSFVHLKLSISEFTIINIIV